MTRKTDLNVSSTLLLFCLLASVPATRAQKVSGAQAQKDAITARAVKPKQPAAKVCAPCIRAHMEFLASDALRGRGSATPDELVAATYIGSELQAYGIEPAGDGGGYIEQFTIVRSQLTAPPRISFTSSSAGIPARETTWTHGKEILALELAQAEFSGPLQKVDLDRQPVKVQPGSVIFVTAADKDKLQGKIGAIAQGTAGVLVPTSGKPSENWEELSKKLPPLPVQAQGQPTGLGEPFNLVMLGEEAEAALNQLPDGTIVHFEGTVDEEKSTSWNAVGILRGRDAGQRKKTILLSAHLDHLGIGAPVNGDNIYNGADDDASGTTAVLELARALGAGPKPRRTVIFALFGSEEIGGLGSLYFREHPPLPLKDMVADLEFEMLGRPDPKLAEDTLWLSGWKRSNLGPELAAHGAKLVGDPHPEQNFFRRSDNYVLAKKGVVAQTVSSFGLHKDYHQPSDDLAHIDFQHMDRAIGSLIEPVEWLLNSDFIPKWNEGGQP
jgi:aminopeptidase YwaD